MTTLPVATLIDSIVTLLTEAYAGSPDPRSTWFIDNEPDSGLLGLLGGVSAAEASRSVDGSGQPGTTIASHVEHLRWSLANVNGTLRGEAWQPNWGESWKLNEADEAGWDRLRQALRTEYETLRALLGQQTALPGEFLNGTLALIPHAAFHLGMIRQMLERARAG
jgi:hypothetical protein